MVANLRCNELKEESMQLVENDIKGLKDQADRKMIDGFQIKCGEIIKLAVGNFDDQAHHYD